jgi:aminoglycoside phosphotransferase (APT) family kinase protein
MLHRYADRSGRDLSAIGFHLGLAYFKLAVILEGIHYRYTQGQTLGAGFDTVGAIVEPLIAAGLTSMKEHN